MATLTESNLLSTRFWNGSISLNKTLTEKTTILENNVRIYLFEKCKYFIKNKVLKKYINCVNQLCALSHFFLYMLDYKCKYLSIK